MEMLLASWSIRLWSCSLWQLWKQRRKTSTTQDVYFQPLPLLAWKSSLCHQSPDILLKNHYPLLLTWRNSLLLVRTLTISHSFALFMPGSSMPFSSQQKWHLLKEALCDCHRNTSTLSSPACLPPGTTIAVCRHLLVHEFWAWSVCPAVLSVLCGGSLWPYSELCSQCPVKPVPDEWTSGIANTR